MKNGDDEIELESICNLPDGHRKTVALAAWFQGLFPAGEDSPVLVGEAAVEVYSGWSYGTGVLRFVGEVPPEVAAHLEGMGFSRRGRRWVHEPSQVGFELAGPELAPAEWAVTVEVGERSIAALSPEDVLVDRLASWQFWQTALDGVAAFRIWRNLEGRLDLVRLESVAERRNVVPALEKLREFDGALEGRNPDQAELTAWATTTH